MQCCSSARLWLVVFDTGMDQSPYGEESEPDESSSNGVDDIAKLREQLVAARAELIAARETLLRVRPDSRDQQRRDDQQVIDLYTTATDRLADDQAAIRASGVRLLDRILDRRELVSVYDWDLVLATCADHLRARDPDAPATVDADAAAALLRRRLPLSNPLFKIPVLDLRGMKVRAIDLHDVDLYRSRLADATIDDSDLRGIRLEAADLRRVRLRNVDLRGAKLGYVDFTGACLDGVNLTGAGLNSADFTDIQQWVGVDLSATDLTYTTGLTDEMIAQAVTDRDTKLPRRSRF